MEKLYAAMDRRVNPPKCHYDKVVVLQEPSKNELFTPFYRCGERDNVSIPLIILFFELICVIDIVTLYREVSQLVTLRSTSMDPNRTGLLRMRL
jgi:hypothetical protein